MSARVRMDQRDVVVVAEQPDHLRGLAFAQQAVVDEDAGELVADRLVDQHGRDRRIDAARQAADHAGGCRPGRGCAAIASSRKAAMVQSGFTPAIRDAGSCRSAGRRRACGRPRGGTSDRRSVALVGDDRVGRVLGGADDAKPLRQARDAVAVAHPDGMAVALGPQARRSAGSRPRPRHRRGRTRGDARPRRPRRAHAPWPAGRSRCRAPGARPRRCGAASGVPSSGMEAGPPERITALGASALERRLALSKGTISQ